MAYSVIFSIFGNFTDYCILGDFWHFRSFLVIFYIFADFCYFCIRKYSGKYLDNISAALKTPQIFAQICAVKSANVCTANICVKICDNISAAQRKYMRRKNANICTTNICANICGEISGKKAEKHMALYSIKRGVILIFYTFRCNKKPEAQPRAFYSRNV